jgi:hypothetical protein
VLLATGRATCPLTKPAVLVSVRQAMPEFSIELGHSCPTVRLPRWGPTRNIALALQDASGCAIFLAHSGALASTGKTAAGRRAQ